MARGWHVSLNGVLLSGGDLLSGFIPEDVTATLVAPPEGLGVPGLRTQDATYPQRDGVEMFSDLYTNRIVTLQVNINPDEDCACETPREAARALAQAWKRHCDDTELVIWPNCEEGGPELAGPYGIIGRPRVCDIRWLASDSQVADVTLRFDSVDHRIYLLDPSGTPGSGSVCDSVSGTPLGVNLAEVLPVSPMVDQWYPLNLGSEDPLFYPDQRKDLLHSDHSTLIDNCDSMTGWSVSFSGGAWGNTSSGVAADTGPYIYGTGSLTFPYPGSHYLTMVRSGSVTIPNSEPFLVAEVQVPVEYLMLDPLIKLQASFNNGVSWASPIQAPGNAPIQPNGRYRMGWLAPASFTSLQFRIFVPQQLTTHVAGLRLRGVYRAASVGSTVLSFPGAVTPQIAPGAASSSVTGNQIYFHLFRRTHTSGMIGWWQTPLPDPNPEFSLFVTASNYLLRFTGSGSFLRWNGVDYSLNPFLENVRVSPDPVFIMLTWESGLVRIWTNVDNSATYPSTPHLAQEFVVTGPASPPNTVGNTPSIETSTYRYSDVIAGVNHYGTPADVDGLVAVVASAGLLNDGTPIDIVDSGTECGPIVITFTGGIRPRVTDGDGQVVGVDVDLGVDGIAVIDTSTGVVTVNGVVDHGVLFGDPFFSVAPGQEIYGFGGGDVQVCFRPSVVQA